MKYQLIAFQKYQTSGFKTKTNTNLIDMVITYNALTLIQVCVKLRNMS